MVYVMLQPHDFSDILEQHFTVLRGTLHEIDGINELYDY